MDTGNYRTLAEETRLANDAGFDIERLHHIERRHYETTIDHWLANSTSTPANSRRCRDQHYRDSGSTSARAAHPAQCDPDVVVCRRFD